MKFCTRCSWSISCMPSGRLLTKSRCSRCCSIFSERNISSIFFSLLLIFFSCWLDNLNTLSLFGDNLINGSCISGRCATVLYLVVFNWSDWFIRPHSTSSLKLIVSSSSWFLQTLKLLHSMQVYTIMLPAAFTWLMIISCITVCKCIMYQWSSGCLSWLDHQLYKKTLHL